MIKALIVHSGPPLFSTVFVPAKWGFYPFPFYERMSASPAQRCAANTCNNLFNSLWPASQGECLLLLAKNDTTESFAFISFRQQIHLSANQPNHFSPSVFIWWTQPSPLQTLSFHNWHLFFNCHAVSPYAFTVWVYGIPISGNGKLFSVVAPIWDLDW